MSVLHEHKPPDKQSELLAELKAIRREQSAIRRLLDEFCGAYLNAKFPFGVPVDRWRRRRGA